MSEQLANHFPEAQLAFVGVVDGFERPLIERSGELFQSYDQVQAGPVHGVNPLRLVSSLVKLAIGTVQAFRLLGARRPQVMLSTGGWVGLPLSLAAWLRRVPVIIYLPDIEPGLTIKALRWFANRIALTVAESEKYFPKQRTVVTGYPLRTEITLATRDIAINHFDLDPARKILLVFGGSRGARAINIVVGDILDDLLSDGIQVIHVTGTLDWERSQAQVGVLSEREDYHAYAYLHDDMGLAFAAADLVVCRAGASILGEFPYFRLPSILIPLAYSWRYQQVNADYLAERGAALHMNEADIDAELLSAIRSLFNDEERLNAMAEAAEKLATGNGAEKLAALLAQLAQERS